MIAILLAFFYIKARGLQVAVFNAADPYIFPRRWNSELFDSLKNCFITKCLLAESIMEFIAFFNAINSWLLIVNINKVNRFCGFLQITFDGLYRPARKADVFGYVQHFGSVDSC